MPDTLPVLEAHTDREPDADAVVLRLVDGVLERLASLVVCGLGLDDAVWLRDAVTLREAVEEALIERVPGPLRDGVEDPLLLRERLGEPDSEMRLVAVLEGVVEGVRRAVAVVVLEFVVVGLEVREPVMDLDAVIVLVLVRVDVIVRLEVDEAVVDKLPFELPDGVEVADPVREAAELREVVPEELEDRLGLELTE